MDEQKKNKKAEVKKKVENEEVSTTVDTPDFSKIQANKMKNLRMTMVKDIDISTKLD